MPKEAFVGIDVSKDRLDVHILPKGVYFSSENDAKGIASLAHLGQFEKLS